MGKTGPKPVPIAVRFRRFFKKTEGCWNWTGCIRKNGYGKFGVGAHKVDFAHRVSYTLFKGPIPEGMCVLHSCDNRRCVNPNHLFLGTHQDNMDDMEKKGRKLRGTDMKHAVLTEDQVREIRRRYPKENGSALAREFGVSTGVPYMIYTRRRWKHVTDTLGEK